MSSYAMFNFVSVFIISVCSIYIWFYLFARLLCVLILPLSLSNIHTLASSSIYGFCLSILMSLLHAPVSANANYLLYN